MQTIYVGDLGPDGKYSVTYTGETGMIKRTRLTRDQLIMESYKCSIVGIHIDPLEWPETMSPDDIEEYEPS